MTEPVKAVLFDIDGTLVDSNYLHIDAWDRALTEVGHPVNTWRIHRAIGMDSGKLLEALLEDDVEALGDRAKEAHTRLYEAAGDRLRSFGQAQELLRTLAERGYEVVLATSAPENELQMLRRTLDVEDAIATLTSAEDVAEAKPSPDIVQVALQKAGVAPDEAIFVGDTVWDVEAAGRAGVATIGLRSGGVSEGELRDAGAVAVYDDAAHLLAELDSSLLRR
jgi:HAD superfamily hydrolase (TIGR01509 family)